MDSSASSCDIPLSKWIPFKGFAGILQRVSEASKPKLRKERFAKFVEEWRNALSKRAASPVPICDEDQFFTVLRLCLPKSDHARPAYGMKELRLGKLIADALGLKGTQLGKQLEVDHDLPDAVLKVLKQFHHQPDQNRVVSVWRVNQWLDALSSHSSDEAVKSELRFIIFGMPDTAVAWLVRMVLKDEFSFGLSTAEILDFYHPEASTLFRYQSKLQHVCTLLADPNKKLERTGELRKCRPFVFCQPMLSERKNVANIDHVISGLDFYIETKYDGERFQLHKIGSSFLYYSKNGHDRYSDKFGTSYDSGTLTPSLRSAFSDEIEDLIIDGEMMLFNAANGEFVPMARSDRDVKRQKFYDWNSARRDGVEDCFVVFDILYAKKQGSEGQTLVEVPLADRLNILSKVVRPVPNKLAFANRSTSRNTDEVAEALRLAMERGDEGLIVKKVDSKYQAGIRFGGGWFKVKPDYSDELVDSLDLLVMGADYGTGRHSRILRSFTCGVREVSASGSERFVALVVVGGGFTDDKLQDLNVRLTPIAIKTSASQPPRNMLFCNKFPPFWFKPETAPVFRVKATELMPKDDYPLGRTLRFPRFREERAPSESNYQNCMTAAELLEFRMGPLGKSNLSTSEIAAAADGLPSSKRRKTDQAVSGGRRKVLSVLGALDPAEQARLKEIAASATNRPLADREVSILGIPDKREKEIRESLAKFGARFSVFPDARKTHFLIAYKMDIYVQSYIKENLWDILTGEWFDQCIAADAFIEPRKLSDFFHMTPRTRRIMVDRFGNPFMGPESADELKASVTRMKAGGLIEKRDVISREEIMEFMDSIHNCQSKCHLFRQFVAYFGEPVGKFTTHAQFYFSIYGGRIANDMNEPGITHFIVDERHYKNQDWSSIALSKRAHFVNSRWVDDSVRDGTVHEDRLYRPL